MLKPCNPNAQALLKHHAPSIAQAMPYVRDIRTHVTTTHLLALSKRWSSRAGGQQEFASLSGDLTSRPPLRAAIHNPKPTGEPRNAAE